MEDAELLLRLVDRILPPFVNYFKLRRATEHWMVRHLSQASQVSLINLLIRIAAGDGKLT